MMHFLQLNLTKHLENFLFIFLVHFVGNFVYLEMLEFNSM